MDPQEVLDIIKDAIKSAYKKDYGGEVEEIEDTPADQNGSARIFKGKKEVTPPGFGRIAAQTAKQVLLQRIRDAEKGAIFSE